MRPRLPVIATGVLVALTLPACGGSPQLPGPAPGPKAQGAGSFNQADADFIPAMNQLLGQAATLNETAERRATNPKVKRLARSMRAEHGPQFDQLVLRMEEVGRQPDLKTTHDHGDSAHTIPGYLPEADLTRLTKTKGRNFDTMFLKLMARHHQGAINATRAERAKGSHQLTKDLAAQIESSLARHEQEMTRLNE
jgi:uncharacterized protein (DUF305 family)